VYFKNTLPAAVRICHCITRQWSATHCIRACSSSLRAEPFSGWPSAVYHGRRRYDIARSSASR